MNYITDERKMIQQMARDFALEQVLPIANKLDPEQGEIPMSLRDKMAERLERLFAAGARDDWQWFEETLT